MEPKIHHHHHDEPVHSNVTCSPKFHYLRVKKQVSYFTLLYVKTKSEAIVNV
jgi:hypothetical protein